MASKSVSYKEVAVAPPGTVLKPLMEPVEESNEKEPETQTCSITNETSMEEINTTSVVDNVPDDGETVENHDHGTQSEKSRSEHDEIPISNQERSDETNGSKLSAAAEPFNPGALSVVHTLNSVSGTSIYDVRASQSMLAEPGAPPLAARVSCGPRSPLYYRNAISYRMKQVQHNVDSGSKPVPSEKKFESSSDAIANDSAIIKVLYGDEEKTDQVTQSNEHEQSKAIDVNNKKNDDGEGMDEYDSIINPRKEKSPHQVVENYKNMYMR
ncbi:hypothetical protein GH714_033987 [Hevea brasiliensis]|uniref:Uncharacterized protein n=1 Tax=Hevea brasiliensis TaxID=3981 RepID=A0A6A6NE75_HEVBR|nr:hypothetical protein GH714_033987 [Hevea brasiliensis]